MSRKSKLDSTLLKDVRPGQCVWENGIGYRRHLSGNGGTWYIRYRAPIGAGVITNGSSPRRQIEERLPNCLNRTQALRILEDRRAKVFTRTFRPAAEKTAVTLAEFKADFLRAKRHLRSVSKYEQQLDDYLIPALGKLPLSAITRNDCKAYYALRLDAGVAIATANGEMACLKSLFTEAIDAGLCETNPVRAVKLRRPDNIRDRILSEAETSRLFIDAERRDDYVRPLFFFLFFTGARLNEALSLTWRDIERDHARVIIRTSKTGEGRIVPLHNRLQKELERWRPFTGGSRWVFPNPDNPAHRIQHIYKGWAALCKAAEVTDLTRHDLRHNFVSMLQAVGIADSIIMSMTGHKTTATLHRYSHTNDQMKRDALAAFPQPTRKGEVVPLHPAVADEKA